MIFSPSRNKKGFALILILGLVALVAVLVLTFFVRVRNGVSETATYSQRADAEQLGGLATQIVEAQIRAATTGGRGVGWASQPGMIRTWSNSGPYAAAINYRLYSWDTLSATGPFLGDDISAWKSGAASFNAQWCDLNSPLARPDPAKPQESATLLDYPITTPPLSLDAVNGVATNDPVNDPSNTSSPGIQGYAITAPPGFSAGAASPTNNPAPMPAKWLYVLQDGTVAAPTAGGAASSITVPGASKANPITGRIAFWTDDETCKVNLNTASEGTFWDTPRTASIRDYYMGRYQPSQNEYQRYPGHPAMTCLSPIFPGLSAVKSNVYDLIPRVSYGGSLAGIAQPDPVNGGQLTPDTDRLFASVDEFFYKPSTSPTLRTTATSVIVPASTNDVAMTREINQKRFFLTVSSRAPETNLFNTPRISLWPICTDSAIVATHTAGTREDAFDKLLAFCGSLWKDKTSGLPYEYFFSRADPLSPDFDYSSIPRNKDIYSYLTALTSLNVPGYGSNFSAKYGANNRDELLTQSFDYARSGPDLVRTSDMNITNQQERVHAGYTVAEGGGVVSQFCNLVVPIQIVTPGGTATKGIGNFRYITGVGLGFYAEMVQPINAAGNPITTNPMDPSSAATKPVRVRYTIRPQLLVQTHQPGVGWARSAMINNVNHSGDTRSLRYRAAVAGAVPKISPSHGGGKALNELAISGGAIDMPWGYPCEMATNPESNTTWDSVGQIISSPTSFLVAASGTNRTSGLSTGNGAYPGSAFRDGSAASLYSVAYRAKTPIVLEYDLPKSITDLSLATDKNKLWIERIEALLTKTLNPIPAGSIYEYALPADNWTPRMVVDGATLNIQLAFTPDSTDHDGSQFPASDLVQSMQVTFPRMTLPVPSHTYASGSGGTAINYSTLKDGSVTDITKWPGYWDHQWFRQGFANRYRIAPAPPTGIPPSTTTSDGNNSNGPSASAQIGDVVRELELDGTPPAAFPSQAFLLGDWRLAALQPGSSVIPDSWFKSPTPGGSITVVRDGYTGDFIGDDQRVHSFGSGTQAAQTLFREAAHLVSGLKFSTTTDGWGDGNNVRQASSNMTQGALMSTGSPGDWNDDNGSSHGGAVFSMPDVGALGQGDVGGTSGNHWSYFTTAFIQSVGADGISDANQYAFTYSPNRQLYSPLQLGTLLTQASGTNPAHPWQTLLFCPNSAAAIDGTHPHPGAANPPDHTYADLFWTPVVDPYPISETLSTAGKINLNYQMEPFHHITRATALYALLKSTQITAHPDSLAFADSAAATGSGRPPTYKPGYIAPASIPAQPDWKTRYPVAIAETLKGFQARFDSGKIFPSASAICEMFLYPTAALTNTAGSKPPAAIPTGPALVSWAAGDPNIINWWKTQRLTGDNTREQPYAHLYPRLTTKSNTYTVHVRTQTLKQRPGTTDWTRWEEGKDSVISEYRGSETIERYLSPNDVAAVDYITDATGDTVDKHYFYRTLQKTRFTR